MEEKKKKKDGGWRRLEERERERSVGGRVEHRTTEKTWADPRHAHGVTTG